MIIWSLAEKIQQNKPTKGATLGHSVGSASIGTTIVVKLCVSPNSSCQFYDIGGGMKMLSLH